MKKSKGDEKWELSVRDKFITTNTNLFHTLSRCENLKLTTKSMEDFVQAWIANDDNEIEGKWEDWYTDKVKKISLRNKKTGFR